MSQKLAANAFRSVFKTVDKETLHWFPGHMGKGLRKMQNKLKSVDCVIEVHDARIPLSGRNTDFKHTISGIKPHILVLNKVDLIPRKYLPQIREKLSTDCENIIFTNCKDHSCKGVKKLFPLAQELINQSDRFNRSNAEDYCIMIIGVPNVGKSSLVNSLRNKFLHKPNATAVGANPGMTRSVLTKIKINENPLFYMLDTPGILTPSVPNTEVGLKLALCATIQDHLVGEETIADYLLYWLNKHEMFKYVDVFKLKAATDDILEVLAHIAINNNKMLKFRDITNGAYVRRPDLDAAAKLMLQIFRNGGLGKIILDQNLL
ncbi:mitochondrial ribosome-associated gtpase 1 [Holotrichia oblita]|uniref:Mitochondrial ribosome-associated gtpase 1 n=1 Tax=Holotrichia oblita TaxID=644536 RepID=A0ACB9TI82_HOLOL|nr:mitochondrial ribosome-associated gtpase 1 [Holotrichia oblita]